MRTLPFSIGIATLILSFPFITQASYGGYCGDRVCYSYDSNGACNNYTCFGDGYYGSFSRNYDRYYNDSRYYDDYYYDTRRPYRRNCRRQRTNYRIYRNRYNYDDFGCNGEYRTTYRPYNRRRSSRSSYYYDDYYSPRYDDRVYIPKAGYYYRY